MFKPAKKNVSSRPKEKANFKLDFQATRIPQRGWDKLLVSLVSLETGKVAAKTGKVSVKSGICQWSESLYESINVSLDSHGKDSDKKLYKLVVSMGLSRFGILGEATINIVDYTQATAAPTSLTLPLQNCNFGSLLHVKIQRIMPKSTSRDLLEPMVSSIEQDAQLDDQLDSQFSSDEPIPLTGPRYSSDSLDLPSTPALSECRGPGEDLMSPSSSVSSCSGRLESGAGYHDYNSGFDQADAVREVANGSFFASALNGKPQVSAVNHNLSARSSKNTPDQWNGIDSSSWRSMSGSHIFYEDDGQESENSSNRGNFRDRAERDAVEATIEELRLEVASREQHGKQLGMEIEALTQLLGEETRRSEELHSKLSALVGERDSIKQEMEILQRQVLSRITVKDVQEELGYEKTLNSKLSLQLRKTQESNSELMLEIKDLESLLQERRHAEKQAEDMKFKEVEQLRNEVNALKKELKELDRDSQELAEENLELLSQLKQAGDKLEAKPQRSGESNTDKEQGLVEEEVDKLKELAYNLREKLINVEESFESKLSNSRALIDDLNSSVLVLRSKNSHLEMQLQRSEDHASELMCDVERMRKEIEGHAKEGSLLASQRGQLKGLREKAAKAEHDHVVALKRLEELEASSVELDEEKRRVTRALELQLENFKEDILAMEKKYNGAMQIIESLRLEMFETEREATLFRKAKEDGELSMIMLRKQIAVLQDKLCQEELKVLNFLQDSQQYEAKSSELCQDLNAARVQVRKMEQVMIELEAAEREGMGCKARDVQEENCPSKAQIEELEAKILDLEISNSELAEKLSNAQEDIKWTKENTNTLVKEIQDFEAAIESGGVLRSQLEQAVVELEGQKWALAREVEKLLEENLLLKKEVEGSNLLCRNAMDEKEALLVHLQLQNIASRDLEAEQFKVKEALVKESSMVKKFKTADGEVELLKQEMAKHTQKILELEAKCALIEQEKEVMSAEMEEVRGSVVEADKAKSAVAALKQEKRKVEACLEKALEELAVANARMKSHEEVTSGWKQIKATLEEKILHLQHATTKVARCPLEEQNDELNRLKKQTNDLKRKLLEQEVEREELRERLFSLEEELQCKANDLALAERKLIEKEPSSNNGGTVSLLARSLSRANSKVGPMSTLNPSRDAKELTDLRGKVKLMELEVKRKAAELEVSKQQFKEQQAEVAIRIEHLELANEQLLKERSHSNMDAIVKELNGIQNQNAVLYECEEELLSKLASKGSLHSELESLREEKKQLESALSKFNAASDGEKNMSKRVAVLETELAEVIEANSMYKSQLQSAFAKQQNVHTAAIENMGSVDRVLKDLTDLKKSNLVLDDELRDMRERYFNMSLQFAEVEAEREELVMTIRNLRGANKKLIPYKSANF